jgi:hypothetical protein
MSRVSEIVRRGSYKWEEDKRRTQFGVPNEGVDRGVENDGSALRDVRESSLGDVEDGVDLKG